MVELENPWVCPVCKSANGFVGPDGGRVECATCCRIYWRVGAGCRFQDCEAGGSPTFKLFIPEFTGFAV